MTTRELLTRATADHRAGRLDRAEAVYRQVLEDEPANADALHLLGVVFLQRNNFAEAVTHLQKAAAAAPKRADVLSHLGMALRGAGRIDDAVLAYSRAVAANESYAEAHFNLGNLLAELDQTAGAEAAYHRALALQPSAVVHNNLGNLLWRQGRQAEASESFAAAVKLDAKNAEAHNNLGALLKDGNRFDEAALSFERALALKPDFSDALTNLGNVRRSQGRMAEAGDAYTRVLLLRPDDMVAQWSARLSLPNFYDSEAEIDDAREAWSRGLMELENDLRLDTPARIQEAKRALLSQTNFNLHYHGRNDRDLQFRYGALLNRIAAAAFPQYVASCAPRPRGKRIRVGFVSPSLFRHTVCHLFGPWITGLDRRRFEVQVFHAAGPVDEETERLRASADIFHTGFRGGDSLVARLAAAELDAIIYLDIGMAPIVQLPAALRLAPLQCATWGHPVTTGLSTIDVYLTSELMEPPDGDADYRERLERMPNIGIAYPYPKEAEGTAEANDRPLFVCMQSLFKLLPRFDRLAAGIANETGPSRFVFFRHAADEVTARFSARLARAFAAAGVDFDLAVRFEPVTDRAAYFAFNRQADVLLDSLFWTGGKTTLDAFACDRPVVSLPGPMMRGRHTAAMAERMGVTETMAGGEDDYIAIGARLGRDREWRRAVSERIRANKAVLFDDATTVRALEAFLEREVAALK